jgi:hypothetical protein
VHLLPYMEQPQIYSPVDFDLRLEVEAKAPQTAWFDVWIPGDPTRIHYESKIPMYLCPSDDPYSNSYGTFAAIHTYRDPPYVSITGWFYPAGAPYSNLGRSSYVGVTGYMGHAYDQLVGCYTSRNTIRLEHVIDGNSQTLMFGEAMGRDLDINTRSQIAHSWVGSGVMSTAWGLGPSDPSESGQEWYKFSSQHGKIVHFTLADASVRPISHTIDYNVYQYISGIHDRKQIDVPDGG